MTEAEKNVLMNRALEMLREQFGAQVAHEPGGPVAVGVIGHEFPILVLPNSFGEWPLYQVLCPVAGNVDWATKGLPEYLLSENETLFFGRFQRTDEGIMMEHELFASTSGDEFGAVIRTLAHRAVRLVRELHVLGALTVATTESDA